MSKPLTRTYEQFTRLNAFRQAAYACLGNARDALFELGDAVIVTPAVNSFVELSCAPVFQRRWPSVYEALQDGRPDRQALLRLYRGQMKTSQRPILAGDHTAWPWVTAYTLQERTIEHQPTKVPGNFLVLAVGIQAIGRRCWPWRDRLVVGRNPSASVAIS